MSLNMYQIAIPTFVRGLENLSAILKKGEESGIENLTTAKLAEDMFPLTRQVQIASDAAKFVVARLAGKEIPSYEDSETTFTDLQTRISKTITFLNSVSESELSGTATKQIQFSNKAGDFNFTGSNYLLQMAIPNFYFHIATAYDILRNQGVTLGKKDYLGTI